MAYNKEDIIAIRRKIHSQPELAFEEIQTGDTIVEYLITICKLPAGCIRRGVAKTGIIVDIVGEGVALGSDFCVAFRADMDCLPITESTTLPYKSLNHGKAHSCGHDGHVASLLGFAALISDRLNEIPCNKRVRLIFQPAEEFCRIESTGGARVMIEEGCLEGVNEIYGYHNFPGFDLGSLAVKDGVVMADITVLKIIVNGKGGHASMPHQSNNPVDGVVDVFGEIKEIVKEFKEAGRKFTMTFPVIQAGTADNVIPDSAYLAGTLRTLEEGLANEIVESMRARLPNIASNSGCTIDLGVKVGYPQVINTKEQADIVERLGIEFFGEKIVSKDNLPLMAAEDFSFYTQKVPGCFFFIGGKENENEPTLHSSNYDFKDINLELVAKFFMRILEDRFSLNH